MPDLKKLILQGKEAYNNKEYEKAAALLGNALELKEDLADVHNILGVIYHHFNEMELAKKHFEKALIINPSYTEAALNLSVTYNELGKYDEARKIYTRAMSNSKNHPMDLDPFVRGKLSNMHAELAEAYRQFGLYNDSIREYQNALNLAPTFMDLRTKLAEVYREQGNLELAEQELLKVMEQKPEYIPALIALGVLFFKKENFKKSEKYFEEVLKLDPNNKSCILYLKMIDRTKEESKSQTSISNKPEEKIKKQPKSGKQTNLNPKD